MKKVFYLIAVLGITATACSDAETVPTEDEIMDRVMSKVQLDEPEAPDPIESMDKPESTGSIEGKWAYAHTLVTLNGDTVKINEVENWSMTFNEDGTFMEEDQDLGIHNSEGTYTLSGNTLEITRGDKVKVSSVSIADGVLTMQADKGGIRQFHGIKLILD